MNSIEKKFRIADLAIEYFNNKVREPKYELASRPYYTYLVEVAVFGEDFHQPPTIKPVQVRLSNDESIQLLQWQLHNPKASFNDYSIDVADTIFEISFQIEEQLWENEDVGTYAVNLTELRNDVATILRNTDEDLTE